MIAKRVTSKAQVARERIAKARERGRKALLKVRARAKQLVDAAKTRAKKWLDAARVPSSRLASKSRSAKTKRKTQPKGKRKAMSELSFADQVLNVVRSKGPQKFGDRAFIASVWDVGFRQLVTLERFRTMLLKAHRSGDLELSRAELDQTINPTMVKRSETRDGIARYHLIRPAPRAKMVPRVRAVDGASVMRAYSRISSRTKSPNVLISDLHKESKVPLESLKPWLMAESIAHRVVPILGEPVHASAEQLSAALMVEGAPHLYVRFFPAGTTFSEADDPVEVAILKQAIALAGEGPVRIAVLRRKLSKIPVREFDNALRKLHGQQRVALYRDDTTGGISSEGAFMTGGHPRHLLYVL